MAEQKKTTTRRKTVKKSEHVQMKRADGKTATVHTSMIDEYRKGGYELEV
ncbi:MAG: hypothetical protein RQ783_08535 [Gammaproteobacteria bacterium]|nr:hypothetical protein [Gammaproteobacteria bacterium]